MKKKSYSTPKLTRWGTVADLTKSDGGPNACWSFGSRQIQPGPILPRRRRPRPRLW